jgi:NTP pyrophosphatase (non-canonical NTP hydrolase)
MSEPVLPEKPTLKDYQDYLAQIITLRGFADETPPELFMLFLEECGELAKAARKQQNLKTGKHSQEHNLGHEAADVLVYLLEICNAYDIDLEKAFREKEAINSKRVWS